MKNIIPLIAFLFYAQVIFSQIAEKATINHHWWAAGMCCASGSDYTISIQTAQNKESCFDSIRIQIDGMLFTISENLITKNRFGDSLLIYNFKFGTSSNRNSYLEENIGLNFYGIVGDTINFIEDHSTRLILIRHEGEKEIFEIEHSETMTAYP